MAVPTTPRRERDLRRARRAADLVRSAGGSAMQVALAQIGAAFDEAAVVNAFKLRVENIIRLGPQHPFVRARFGARTAMLAGQNLGAAIATVERWHRNERKALALASAFGRGSALPLETLRELRLILRLMRRRRMHVEFGAILAAVCDDSLAVAAE